MAISVGTSNIIIIHLPYTTLCDYCGVRNKYVLNAIQLRLLWTSLVGTFCALGVVLYDLNFPFRGSYQVSTQAINELLPIRQALMNVTEENEHNA